MTSFGSSCLTTPFTSKIEWWSNFTSAHFLRDEGVLADDREGALQRRRRNVTWVVPTIDGSSTPATSTLDLIREVRDGRTPPPPVWRLVNFRLSEIEEGRAVFEIQFQEYHYNRFGKVQGGIECAVLDAAMGYAVHSTLPAGAGYTTLEMKINYLRPITSETGLMRCSGGIIHKGSRIATAEARLLDCHDLLYAHSVCTCLILGTAKDADAPCTPSSPQ
jgi:uncharacterized protein (TIGR00369 family)